MQTPFANITHQFLMTAGKNEIRKIINQTVEKKELELFREELIHFFNDAKIEEILDEIKETYELELMQVNTTRTLH